MDQPIKDGANVFNFSNFDPELFLGFSTVLYGPSKTGKSYLLNEYLLQLKTQFYLAVVFSSTAFTDKEFPMNNYTPSCLIRDTLDIPYIEDVVQFSTKRMEVYRCSREFCSLKKGIMVLQKIYNNYSEEKRNLLIKVKIIRKAEKKLESDIPKTRKTEIRNEVIDMYITIMKQGKKFISKNKISLESFDNEDIVSILFCKLNPNILIVFNDLGDRTKTSTKKEQEILCPLFTRGRHTGITVVFLAQTPGQLPPDIRNNAHNSIFTSVAAIGDYLDKCKMNHMKSIFLSASSAIILVDEKLPRHQKKFIKIFYSKELNKIFYVRADEKGEQSMIGDPSIIKRILKHEINKTSEITRDISNFFQKT